jgi:hypothetical protein
MLVPPMGEPEQKNDLAELLASRLAIYLGAYTARTALKTFSHKALGRGPETLTPADIPKLGEALRPMLRTFVGRAQAEVLLKRIRHWSEP